MSTEGPGSSVAPGDDQGGVRNKTIPVTLVTGFLGAGKTSLLNKVVQMCEEKKIAVIENEFGVVNLDAKLVSNQLRSKEDLVTISNGCICCSLRKDILTALAELKRRSSTAGQPYDNIILETTGLADPAPVAFTFFANPWVKKNFHLDSIVTVVDALHLHKHLTHAGNAADSGAVNETVNQIAFADMVLLNKIDLVSGEQLIAVEDAIRGINAIARLVHTRLDTDDCPNWITRIDPQFLDTATSSDEEDPEATPAGHSSAAHANNGGGSSVAGPSSAMVGDKRGVRDMHGHGSSDDLPSGKLKKPRWKTRALHDLNFVRSIGILLPGALDNYLFNMFMRDLLLERGKDIFRSKGTLCIHGQKRLFNFQGVHETFQFAASKLLTEADAENPHSEIVFIGRDLDKDAIKQGLLSCMWRPLPPGWEEFHDKKTHRSYYVNKRIGGKTWTRPVDEDSSEVNDAAGVLEGVEAGTGATLLQNGASGTLPISQGPDAVAVTERCHGSAAPVDDVGRKSVKK